MKHKIGDEVVVRATIVALDDSTEGTKFEVSTTNERHFNTMWVKPENIALNQSELDKEIGEHYN